jgi:dTDP-4-amino-4,6-dideoxygalactose transaminase
MIPVTKPFLPPINEYKAYLDGVWNREWLTNNGPLVNEYEHRLKESLGVKNLLFVTNGTIAIQLAIKALELKGEIITTPFSYVATTSSIAWEGCTPVFVDIDADTFNINPALIESVITENTCAILATHCFGNPCDIDAIQAIADKFDLKVIYDAAHCYGSKYKGKSVLEYGDVSTLSLHATKLVHSTEGGLVVAKDSEVLHKLTYMRNFGHNGPEDFYGIGINGKNSEFHAAMGLSVLGYANQILDKRRKQHQIYNKLLKDFSGRGQVAQQNSSVNYSYYPLVLEKESHVNILREQLGIRDVFIRRYFYPLLSSLNYVENAILPVADSVSRRIVCLPLYYSLTEEEQLLVSRHILQILNEKF